MKHIARKPTVICALIFCAISFLTYAQQQTQFIRSVEAHLNKLEKEDDLSGVILIAKDGKPIFSKAYGLANRSYNIKNNTNTKFNLASMSKMFTGMAIMQLMEAGKIELNKTVGTYLPNYENMTVRDSVTIHQLLTHTSGMGNYWEPLFEKNFFELKTLADYEKLFTHQKISFKPGSEFSYSNNGYILLGLIIEKLSGKDYYSYVRDNIFLPLKMNSTDSYELDYVISNMAVGYTMSLEEQGQWLNNIYVTGKGVSAGGGYSTVDDLLRFANAVQSNRLIDSATTNLYTKGRYKYHKGLYGYGFSVDAINGHRIIGHSGGHLGAACELLMFEDLGYTVVILTNGEVENFWDVLNYITLQLVGESEFLKSYFHTKSVLSDVITKGFEEAVAANKGSKIALRASLIDRTGYKLLFHSKNKEAIEVFKFGIQNFPSSASSHYSLAEAHRIIGNKGSAIESYKKYLEIEPGDEEVINKIKILSSK